jgi:HK97 family phage prohead protease
MDATLTHNFSSAIFAASPVPLDVKLAGGDALGLIEGYGSTFGTVDSYGHAVAPSAFAKSLARHKATGSTPAFLWSHDPSEPIGKFTDIREDTRGLYVRGVINQGTQRGREALALLKSRDVTGLSIGFIPVSRRLEKNGVVTLTEIELFEISAVAMPANPRARVIDVKGIENIRDYESFLSESGFPKAASRKLAVGGWRALNDDESNELEELAALVREATTQLNGQD